MTVTAFVVNQDRTKLLMRYHERREQWFPPTSWVAGNEPAGSAAARQVATHTGVVARPIDTITAPGLDQSLLLEAVEHETSPHILEELYDARWLSRDEILTCTCIEYQAQHFARHFLNNPK